MNAPPLFASIFSLLLCTTPAFAQKASVSGPNPLKQFAFYHNSEPGLSHLHFFEKNASAMRIAPSSMVLESQNTDKQGFTHYKYQQYHLGLPIFGCHYMLHEKNGVVQSANGQFQPDAKASAEASLNTTGAVSYALLAIKSKKFDREKTKATLCFFNPSANQASRSLRLAYMVDFHSIEPFEKRRYFIDANTGKILKEYPLLLQEGVPGKAKTYYYGTQDIISDSLGPQNFVLRDLTRGNGIFVYNGAYNSLYTNNSSFWDLGTLSTEEVALDAHYCTEKFYDMMLADYNWSGIDGQGGALIAKVHEGAFINAFWTGEYTSYGDGNCDYGPLTTLEVVGHEFTHGVVQHTSALIYGSESGAINESLSDIFGKLLERKFDPAHFSWDVGHSFLLTANAFPFRVMDDPASQGLPAYYKGQNWSDYSDVHDNSAIGNLWFSMIVDGKTGINEAGFHFNVDAIGPDKAGQIIFNTNKNYLTENATYNDFCHYSIEVAGNLYGQNSPEQLAVKEAWQAVGLPYTIPAGYFDLQVFHDESGIYHNICGLNHYIPVSFTVANNGSVPYNPASQVKITLSCSSIPNKIITLNDPIPAGDSAAYVIDNWLTTNNYGNESVYIEMEAMDGDPYNNIAVAVYSTVQYESNDLALTAYTLEPECLSQTQRAYFFVSNNSCQNIPVGTAINFSARDNLGNTIWVGPTETIGVELTGGNSADYVLDIPIFNKGVTLELLYPLDPYPDNNLAANIKPPSLLPITGNYINNFEVNNGLDSYLLLDNNGALPTISYQNSSFLAATGFSSNNQSNKHCGDPFQAFNDPLSSGISVKLKACLDFSTASAPTLEFDAAEFLSTYSNADNYPFSSMLQARWEGAISGYQIIYDQPEGVVKHTKIDLPPHFKGTLSLNMYTEVGHWQPNAANLGTDDFVLLDNLQFKVGASANHEAIAQQRVLVSPNPARETVRIQSEIPMQSIQVYSAAGQLLQSNSAKGNSQDLALHKLPNGLYWVSIQLENGSESVQKLVKMD